MDTSFEFALDVAKRERTPWLFNYSLRGGWGSSSYLFDLAKENDRADILLSLIALKQIVSLDKPVCFNWVKTVITKFGHSQCWCNSQLSFLVNNGHIISINEIKTMHIETANRFTIKFFDTASNDEKATYIELLQQEALNNNTPLLGIVWFHNAIRSCFFPTSLIYTDDFVNKLAERCFMQTTSEHREQAAFVLEIIHGRLKIVDAIDKLLVIKDWVESVDSATAYAYSKVLNSMINESKDKYREFISSLDLQKVMNQVRGVTNSTLYRWACFLNRLIFSHSRKNIIQIANILPRQPIQGALASISNEHIHGACEMLCSLYYIDTVFAFEEYYKFLPKLKVAFKNNFRKTIAQLDFDFYICFHGLELFTKSRPTKLQKSAMKAFSQCFSSDTLVECFEYGGPNDWQNISYFWDSLYRYNTQVVKGVMPLINLTALEKNIAEMWATQNGDLLKLLYKLCISDSSAVDELIYSKRDIFKELSMPLAAMSLQTAKYMHDNNRSVNIIWRYSHNDWKWNAGFLEDLYLYNNILCEKIIDGNMTEISKTFFGLYDLDYKEYHCFVRILIEIKPAIIDELCYSASMVTRFKDSIYNSSEKLKSDKNYKKWCAGINIFLTLIRNNTTNQSLVSIVDELIDLLGTE